MDIKISDPLTASIKVRSIHVPRVGQNISFYSAGNHVLQRFLLLGKWLPFLLFVSAVWCLTPAFAATQLNTQWEYRMSGGKDIEERNDFYQRYNLNTGFLHQATDAIYSGVNLAYNYNKATGLPFTQVVTPSGSLGVMNDIFTADLSGSYTQNKIESLNETDTYTWEATLGSGWLSQRWPRLSLYYGGNGSETGMTTARPIGYSEIHYGLNLDWDLQRLGKLYYGYLNSHDEDSIIKSQKDTTSHFGRLETDGKFWQDRLIIKLIQSYNNAAEDYSARIPEDGNLPQDLNLQTYAILDPRPWDPGFVYHELTLELNPELLNLQTVAITLAPDQSWHMGVSGIFEGGSQQVNQLRVYVDDPFAELNTNQAALQWDLYASIDNTSWDPVARDVLANYNSTDQRFEINIPELDRPYDFLKLVVSNRSDRVADEVTVTIFALKAFRFLLGVPGSLVTSSSDSNGYNANVNMMLRMTRTLTFTTTSEYNSYESSSSSKRLAFTGNLRWIPIPMFAPSVGLNEIRRESSDSPDVIDRTYIITLPFNPLPTLNFTLSSSQLETYNGDRRTLLRNNYNLNTIAILFPDLNATLGVTYSKVSNLKFDDTVTGKNTLTGTLGLLARINSKLTADFTYNAEKSEKIEISSSRTRYNSSLNLVYRPSDYIYTRLITTKYWTGESPDSIDFKMDVGLVRSYKTQIDLFYRFLESDGYTNATGINASWDLSQIFTFQLRTRYAVGEINEWRILSTLYMNLEQ